MDACHIKLGLNDDWGVFISNLDYFEDEYGTQVCIEYYRPELPSDVKVIYRSLSDEIDKSDFQ